MQYSCLRSQRGTCKVGWLDRLFIPCTSGFQFHFPRFCEHSRDRRSALPRHSVSCSRTRHRRSSTGTPTASYSPHVLARLVFLPARHPFELAPQLVIASVNSDGGMMEAGEKGWGGEWKGIYTFLQFGLLLSIAEFIRHSGPATVCGQTTGRLPRSSKRLVRRPIGVHLGCTLCFEEVGIGWGEKVPVLVERLVKKSNRHPGKFPS